MNDKYEESLELFRRLDQDDRKKVICMMAGLVMARTMNEKQITAMLAMTEAFGERDT